MIPTMQFTIYVYKCFIIKIIPLMLSQNNKKARVLTNTKAFSIIKNLNIMLVTFISIYKHIKITTLNHTAKNFV